MDAESPAGSGSGRVGILEVLGRGGGYGVAVRATGKLANLRGMSSATPEWASYLAWWDSCRDPTRLRCRPVGVRRLVACEDSVGVVSPLRTLETV